MRNAPIRGPGPASAPFGGKIFVGRSRRKQRELNGEQRESRENEQKGAMEAS
jgi:hypothetical protein